MNRVVALSDALTPWHSFWIRVGQYREELSFPVEITNNIRQLSTLEKNDTLFFYRFQPEWGCIVQRLKKLKSDGIRIITDIDDCVWQAPYGWDRTRQQMFTKAVQLCDAITCSTEALQELLIIMFPGKPVHVIRNSAPIIKERSRDEDNRLTLCWSGAPWTRPKDLLILQRLAKWIQDNRINVSWHHIGHADGRLSFADAVGIPRLQVRTTKLSGYKEYLNALTGDIGLAPVADGAFNSFKSEIKLVEYSAAGMTWIGSNTNAYKEMCARWGINGNLCGEPEEWIKRLEQLLIQDDLEYEKSQMRKFAHQYQNRNTTIAQWERIIEGCWEPLS